MAGEGFRESNRAMAKKHIKQYLFASDFDQTLTFNDTGYVLSELLGIATAEFEHKIKGMAKLNLVQQGAELSYLLLHDPEFRSRVRKDHLYDVGKRIRLKENIKQVYEILDRRIDGFHFDFYVLSASPVEVIQSALEGIVPEDHIFGTEFKYTDSGEIESLVRATAGYGKVTRLDQLEEPAGGHGPAGFLLRHRRRGGLDPDRRGAHAADHLRPGRGQLRPLSPGQRRGARAGARRDGL